MAIPGHAAGFSKNGEKPVKNEPDYQFAALPLLAAVSGVAGLGVAPPVLMPLKTPRSNVLSGFALVVSASVWLLTFAAFEASPVPANTGVVFPAIMAFLCAISGSRLIDLNKIK